MTKPRILFYTLSFVLTFAKAKIDWSYVLMNIISIFFLVGMLIFYNFYVYKKTQKNRAYIIPDLFCVMIILNIIEKNIISLI